MGQTIITEFFKRPIAVHPIVVKAFGSVKLGILWSQLWYWHDKTKDKEGWIYKTQQEIYDETGLSRKEQETARRIGRDLGVLEEKLAGQPAKVHYRIDIDKAQIIINDYFQKQVQGQLVLIAPKEKSTNSISYLKNVPQDDIKELSEKYSVSEKFILARAEDVIDYCESKGKSYRDYKATLRNFIKSHLARNPQERIVKSTPAPKPIVFKERTPEEQARINKRLAEIRQNLTKKFSK